MRVRKCIELSLLSLFGFSLLGSECLLSSDLLKCLSMFSLDSFALIFEFESSHFVEIVFPVIIPLGVALGNIGLTAVSGLVAVSEPGYGPDTDILGSEVLVLEVVENLAEIHVVVVATLLLLFLKYFVKLLHNHRVHSLEDLHDVSRRAYRLSLGTLYKGRELDEDFL